MKWYKLDDGRDVVDTSNDKEVYDPDTDLSIYCPRCSNECGGSILVWNEDGECECPSCGYIMSRADYFSSTAMEPPSSECLTCQGPVPYCVEGCPEVCDWVKKWDL